MSDCIFCKIASGEIPSTTIYENNEFKVFLDLFPAAMGHALVVPKNHVANIFELDEEQAGRLFKLVVKVAKVLKKELNFEGMNIIQNNGEVAGQTVHHFHIHLIPRNSGDKVTVKWDTLKPTQQQLNEIAQKIAKQL